MKLNHFNLHKLADYLAALPDDYKEFDMGDFMRIANPWDRATLNRITDYIKNNGGMCGSAACAIGHGPAAGIKVDLSTLEAFSPGPYWEQYCLQAFGVEWGSPEAEWMFGGSWDKVDNTPQGAAACIRYLLAGNPLPTEDFDIFDFLWDDDAEHYPESKAKVIIASYQEYKNVQKR